MLCLLLFVVEQILHSKFTRLIFKYNHNLDFFLLFTNDKDFD